MPGGVGCVFLNTIKIRNALLTHCAISFLVIRHLDPQQVRQFATLGGSIAPNQRFLPLDLRPCFKVPALTAKSPELLADEATS